ncbi:phospholipase D alpha 4 [Typha angustifolia]|uniref:phospholipase D alpha 4 n=1 Tax=Typha angustifolia TaxID=59011 RepID=UPI003C2FE6B6
MEKTKLSNFIHGTLEATIFEASTAKTQSTCTCFGKKPTYVTIQIGKTKAAETNHECDRVWNQSFRILCAHPADSIITLAVRTKLSVLAKIKIPAYTLLNEVVVKPPFATKGKWNTNLKLQFTLQFKPAESELNWGRGLRDGGYQGLVYNTTFLQRSNCRVILYQDAHHHQNFQPPISTRSGELYQPRRLWEDVFKAIDGAQRLIYIVGWSLNPNIVLVRDPKTKIARALGVKLGELLRRKAEEGISVRIMLWDDETSLHMVKNQGVMRTHDEDAFNYFKHTKVVCRLCPRLHHYFPTLFAHHQKTIVVDASRRFFQTCGSVDEGDLFNNDEREIISFLGGLDLCDGRYDTERHSLFRTLDSKSHSNDFYQINFAGASLYRGGPREPWHDVHACVTGEAARDVLTNFEQRWTKQCDPSLLVPEEDIPNNDEPTLARNSSHNWKVQVFRSIDKFSVAELPHEIAPEHSLQDAYVQAIRRADRFIYIENQYFIGGCHLWEEDQHSGCNNLIPVEIALKVVSKIRTKERFAVYIIIPMWPEGIPESEPVQAILHWTRLTMTMMYGLIGKAIKESGVDGHPRDYLNFFCLANREEKHWGEFVPHCLPPHLSDYWKAQQNRRFMIYVHSKLMIVDDEYILLGSANLNQRSMDGSRDTEIAIGCYQPEYVGDRSRKGDIHTYRMSLWYEHTARIAEAYLEPESIHCVRTLRRIGEEMWKLYTEEFIVDMEGAHLVTYPINILRDGTINDLGEAGGEFPDTTALIRGRKSEILPPVCTT